MNHVTVHLVYYEYIIYSIHMYNCQNDSLFDDNLCIEHVRSPNEFKCGRARRSDCLIIANQNAKNKTSNILHRCNMY